ncbi:MAG: DHH family phosphoesterase [Candidatus Diapherotrites archaeon]|nr:DHH family phosphoesterase [Candidatus Diapherotrites archaeon]
MIPKEMLEKAEEIALELMKRDDFVVIHHNDADGITAGAIAFKMLEREKKQVKAKWVKQLYKETIQEIKGLGKNYVFVDFGSGQLDELKKEFNEENFFIFDHHQPLKTEHEFHFNPLLFGVDGGKELSGSGTVFLIALALNEKNVDLSPLAIIGAVGDMQDFKGKLIGVNEVILNKSIEAGLMLKEIDLRLYGRITRPLVQFLMYSSNPILPQLTASEEKCFEFLKEKGFALKKGDKWRTYSDLSEKEKKELTTELIIHLTNFGEPEWKVKELIGEVYTLLNESKNLPTRDAKEFSTMLNACGRHGSAEIGLQVCLGDREEFFDKAMDLLAIHRRELSEGIRFVQEKGISEEKEFYFFDAEEKISETIVGIVAGMLYGSGIIESNKPIIAFARNEKNEIKVSGRGTMDLIRKGLNLGKAFKEISHLIQGEGGGHNIAAGMKFPQEFKEKFMKLMNEKIEEQMNLEKNKN